MKSLLVWMCFALIFAAIGGLCTWKIMTAGEHGEHEAAREEAGPSSTTKTTEHQKSIDHDESGNVIVTFDTEAQQRAGLKIQPLESSSHQPEKVGFGVFQEDPALSFTLRAPLPGRLHQIAGRSWPVVGNTLPADIVVGTIEPRLSPVEQVDLRTRLAAQKADIEAIVARLAALQTAYESKRAINVHQKIIADQVLQEMQAQIKGEEARLTGARETAKVLNASLNATTQPTEVLPLRTAAEGQVVEVFCRPGESVESGQAILRLTRFDRLIARISLTAGEVLSGPFAKARIILSANDQIAVEGNYIGLSPSAEMTTGGQTYLFAVEPGRLPLQPGMAFTAYLQLPGQPEKGVTVPRSSAIRLAGRTWLYLLSEPEKFVRREIALDTPVPEGWFVKEGLKPGEKIVVQGAQSLLAEEVKLATVEEEE